MTFLSIFIIALALSLDAFGVALSIGLNCRIKIINKIYFLLSFAFFQFLFAFIGAYSGTIFNKYVTCIPSIVGGAIVAMVGVMMIKNGMEGKEGYLLLNPKMYVILGISVSIDALIVGFTALSAIGNIIILMESSLFIGLVTLILTFIAFIISKFLHRIEFICKYADYIGGIILVILGLKMMFWT
ncbi:manganese efflux pump MntP family protein [Clostridium sp. MSJ-4]|uniref:Putative manganese efflux pump MntP n=1 Tax=Clostridium simiarum TaxID=2841506 RepID=A0ABS6F350_9CLOT|nr:manganese efflux pump [Clostridium simiarum]MBU5592905.1 manganese efflux pump MntP family protein [Clostridium simiarum]